MRLSSNFREICLFLLSERNFIITYSKTLIEVAMRIFPTTELPCISSKLYTSPVHTAVHRTYLLGITVLRTIHNLLTVWRILRGTPEFSSWFILDVNTSAYGISSLAESRVKCSIICITCVWFTGTAENAKKRMLPSLLKFCNVYQAEIGQVKPDTWVPTLYPHKNRTSSHKLSWLPHVQCVCHVQDPRQTHMK